ARGPRRAARRARAPSPARSAAPRGRARRASVDALRRRRRDDRRGSGKADSPLLSRRSRTAFRMPFGPVNRKTACRVVAFGLGSAVAGRWGVLSQKGVGPMRKSLRVVLAWIFALGTIAPAGAQGSGDPPPLGPEQL